MEEALNSTPLARCELLVEYNFASESAGRLADCLSRHARRVGAGTELVDRPIEHLTGTLVLPGGWRVVFGIEGLKTNNGQICFDEHLLQAASGLMSVHGRTHGDLRWLGIDYLTQTIAILALTGAVAHAVRARRFQRNARFTLSAYRCALLATAQYLSSVGLPDADAGAEATQGSRPLPFISREGVRFEIETLNALPWMAFWSDLGLERDAIEPGWAAFQGRYANATCRLAGVFFETTQRHPFAVLARKAENAGLSICALNGVSQSTEVFAEFKALYPFRSDPESVGPLPLSDTDAVSLPLSGISVLESCRRIQGPFAGYLLALLGADVCRIEPPGGDPLRFALPAVNGCSVRFDAINRNKSVIEIDLKSPSGQEHVKALAERADVFLQNWAPGKAEEFSLTHTDLFQKNGSLVYVRCAGWQPENTNGLLGTDFMTQAYTGLADVIATASGGAGGTLMTITDLFAGVMAAFNTTLALFDRDVRMRPIYVYSSLETAADLLKHSPSPAPSSIGMLQLKDGLAILNCMDLRQQEEICRLLGVAGHGAWPALGGSDLSQSAIDALLSDWATPYVFAPTEMDGIPELGEAKHHLRNDGYWQVRDLWGA